MRTRTSTAAVVAILIAAGVSACGAVPAPSTASEPSAALDARTSTPSRPRPTVPPDQWVVNGIGASGPKIGADDPAHPTTLIVFCVPKSDYREDEETSDPDVPEREVVVKRAVWDAAEPGQPCPPGEDR